MRRRRTWPQRAVLTAGCLSVTLCLLAAGGLGWFYWRFNQIPSLTFGEGTLARDLGGPQNFLLVGSDSAAGLGEGDPETAGRAGVTGQRADTIIVLRIEPKSKRAALLSIPRDTFVPLAGTGTSGKINEAFSDGPEPLIRTITETFRIPIHHYVQVDFAGFKGLVNAVGGVDVFFASPARDQRTGLQVDAPGCHRFDGTGALAYVRSRHYEYLEGGRWVSDLRADLSRIDRQQDFIRRAVAKVLSKRLNPVTLNRLSRVGAKYVQRDAALGLDEILALGDRFRNVDPATLETYELPTVASADLSRQEVVKEPAELILARFRPKPSAGRAVVPSGVRVRVLNGTGAPGQATSVRDALAAIGFVVALPGDAPPYGREQT